VFQKVFRLLDHPWLARIGNLRTLVSIASAGVVALAAIVVALVNLFTSVGPVPLAFFGLALVIFGLAIVQKIQERRIHPGVDSSRLDAATYGAEQTLLQRRAERRAEENIDREAKR
jgi:hypothetical protein